ncbi:SDR family NAD(P)-dependent oxidoreductase [Phenylobacterium sp. Root700]|uniref:SDR family NAD(P)-dependent oxidoreductase n=1 Tax=Phenylobacterium sp. Root700 TaxID=1736591 RepID=UPI0006FCD695|nr:SDR family oxidoreductase [Phenylobacterium sp. Root700]KRB48643.1 2,5-dichloro-2,5-cyclohexadiene-1,4-diol dehydrogenase [Phenylobacterium sp. Root700]
MAGRLDGKVAMITGAASGIGLGTVELFVAEGAQVVAADIQDEKGAMLEKRFPGKVVYAHCDVTSEAEIEAAVKKAKTEFGGLDILFNNAGISDRMSSIPEITAEGWSWIFDILVRGPALGMKHAVPLMLERGGGSIINTASIAGLQAGYGPIAYSTAKAGVIHMSRVAAAQLSPQKIRVNAICPGLIATSIFGASFGLPREVADQMAAQVAENASKAQPVPKAGLPDDIAQAALYLASDAAAFVSGTHLVVDGGITVGSRHAWDTTQVSPFATILGDMIPAQP